jgi:sec-independent protein translocase protein TatB
VFDIGIGEVAVLLIAALFVFGPERLPQVVAQAARTLRQLRGLAAGARAEITEAIGPELRDLDLLGTIDSVNPMKDLGDLRGLTPRKLLDGAMNGSDGAAAPKPGGSSVPKPGGPVPNPPADGGTAGPVYDSDAT